MKAMLIAVVGSHPGSRDRRLRAGPDPGHQEKQADKTGRRTKDTSKDVAHGTKKAAVRLRRNVTKDTSKDVAHGTHEGRHEKGGRILPLYSLSTWPSS